MLNYLIKNYPYSDYLDDSALQKNFIKLQTVRFLLKNW